MQNALEYQFFGRDPVIVARQLLGMLLVSTLGGKRTTGIIVETEAYLAKGDSACHGYRGCMAKNRTMFGPPGFAYVYPIHAKYCFNVVTQSAGMPSAVLIRAVEPKSGIVTMQIRRSSSNRMNLCSGPAKLCQAMKIDRSNDGHDLSIRQGLWIETPASNAPVPIPIKSTRRLGVKTAQKRKLRFVLAGSPFASGPRYLR